MFHFLNSIMFTKTTEDAFRDLLRFSSSIEFYCRRMFHFIAGGAGESGNMVAAIKNESQRCIFHTNTKKLKLSRRYAEMKIQTNVKNIIWEKWRFLVPYHLLNLFSPFNKFFERLKLGHPLWSKHWFLNSLFSSPPPAHISALQIMFVVDSISFCISSLFYICPS